MTEMLFAEKPRNPHIFEGDMFAYYLSNITEIPGNEDTPTTWSATLVEMVPLTEYYKRVEDSIDLKNAQTLTESYEIALELIGGV